MFVCHLFTPFLIIKPAPPPPPAPQKALWYAVMEASQVQTHRAWILVAWL